MRFVVLNGSPKGDVSITMQYIQFIQKKYPSHEFIIHNISQRISKLEEARQITGAMEGALKEIDTINSKMEAKEPIAIFANFLQLRIIRTILDVWGKVPGSDVKAAAACDWWCKGEKILKTKFPKEHFLEKDIVVELVGEINSFKQPGCACPSN